ncbi:hypothetical protein CAG57_02770 [Vibrio sp. V30_P3S12P165]|nr:MULTISPECIES: hypothetical protein [unclassified Vibrio]NAW70018.1 hypothetical protein [Vibrio sp. V28_P6S34P95]NAX04089.1 hypothetical protein [Vibrio sp. V30_P3S12P165]
MHKKIVMFLFVIILSGCVTTAGTQGEVVSGNLDLTSVDQEQIYTKTSNYSALIELYKRQLKQGEESETRLKLAEVYLNYQDAESALFTLAPLINHKSNTGQVFYLQGLALFRLGKIEEAKHSLHLARDKSPMDAKVINLLAIIYAQQGDLVQSRALFTQARELMFDDITIKNNLALIDMLEGDYDSAAARLLPIYMNEQADEQVKANLAIIMAKKGSLNHLLVFYADQYSQDEIVKLYQSLRSLNLASNINFADQADAKIVLDSDTVAPDELKAKKTSPSSGEKYEQ